MFTKLKLACQGFTDSKAGERFLDAHETLKCHGAACAIMVIAGGLMVVAGLLLGLVPGVPGVVLSCFGLALIAARFRKLALWLDWLELKCRRLVAGLRRRFTRKVKAKASNRKSRIA